jgi:hypothetical protein
MASYRAMIDAQQSQRIDGGFYSAEAYAKAQAQCRCLEPIVAPRAGDGTAAYYAIIVAAPESGIASVADLAGKVVAMGAADSVAAAGCRSRRWRARVSTWPLRGVRGRDSFRRRGGPAGRRRRGGRRLRLEFAGRRPATGIRAARSRTLVASGESASTRLRWSGARRPFRMARGRGEMRLPEEDKRRIEAHLLGLATRRRRLRPPQPVLFGRLCRVEPDDLSGWTRLPRWNSSARERHSRRQGPTDRQRAASSGITAGSCWGVCACRRAAPLNRGAEQRRCGPQDHVAGDDISRSPGRYWNETRT